MMSGNLPSSSPLNPPPSSGNNNAYQFKNATAETNSGRLFMSSPDPSAFAYSPSKPASFFWPQSKYVAEEGAYNVAVPSSGGWDLPSRKRPANEMHTLTVPTTTDWLSSEGRQPSSPQKYCSYPSYHQTSTIHPHQFLTPPSTSGARENASVPCAPPQLCFHARDTSHATSPPTSRQEEIVRQSLSPPPTPPIPAESSAAETHLMCPWWELSAGQPSDSTLQHPHQSLTPGGLGGYSPPPSTTQAISKPLLPTLPPHFDVDPPASSGARPAAFNQMATPTSQFSNAQYNSVRKDDDRSSSLSLSMLTVPTIDATGCLRPSPVPHHDAQQSYQLPGVAMISSTGDTSAAATSGSKISSAYLGHLRTVPYPELLVSPPHLPPLRPPRSFNAPYAPTEDEDDRCEVCWDNLATDSNPIVACAGCNVLVHQQCYGVCRPVESREDWFCCVCLYWKQLGVTPWRESSDGKLGPPPLLYCVICNRSRGAMKVGIEGKWVHVACILYNKEGPAFRNSASRSAPIDIQKHLITHSRLRHGCSICRSTEGYTAPCSFPGCNKRVHVACVFSKGLRPMLQSISTPVGSAYGGMHSLQSPTDVAGGPEQRMIEKVVPIVTCEVHSTPSALAAVQIWERRQLRRADEDAAESTFNPQIQPTLRGPCMTGPPSLRPSTPANLPLSMGGGADVTIEGSQQNVNEGQTSVSRLPPMMATNAGSGWPPQYMGPQQTPGANASMAGYYGPSGPYGYQPIRQMPQGAPQFYMPWGVPPYSSPYYRPRPGFGGVPTYSQPSPVYPHPGMDNRAAQTPYAAQQAPYGSYWPGQYTAPMMHRHGTTPGYHHRTPGARVRVSRNGQQATASLPKRDDLPTGADDGGSPGSRKPKPLKPSAGLTPAGARLKPDTPATALIKKGTTAAAAIAKPKPSIEINVAGSSKPTKKKKTGAALASVRVSTSAASVPTLAGTKQKDSTAKSRASSSARRKADELDEAGTASGHIVGSGLSSRGYKIVWNKVDSHFRSLRGASQRDPLVSFMLSVEDELYGGSNPNKWRWIFDDSSTPSAPLGEAFKPSTAIVDNQQTDLDTTADESPLMGQLRSIWLKQCHTIDGITPALGNIMENMDTSTSAASTPSAVSRITAPLSVLISTEVQEAGGFVGQPESTTLDTLVSQAPQQSRETWTFWTVDASSQSRALKVETTIGGDESTPTRTAKMNDQGAACSVTLCPSPALNRPQSMCDGHPTASNIPLGTSVKLISAYSLNPEQGAALRSKGARLSIAGVGATGESGDGVATGKDISLAAMTAASPIVATTNSAAVDTGITTSLFDTMLQKALSGDPNPSLSRSGDSSTTKTFGELSKRKGGVDFSSWTDVTRLEGLLVKRYSIPSFFILIKKLPAEVARLASTGASAQAAAVQRFMSSKESVALTLDPQALKKLATTSKKLFVHGKIWDLNPPFPIDEDSFRALLPPRSVGVNALLPLDPNLLNSPPETFPIPIPDEVSKDFLTACLRARQNVKPGSPDLPPEDMLKAMKGEELVKVVASANYWGALLFHDDFVLRQAIHHFQLWVKKRARLRVLTNKIHSVVKAEIALPKRSVEAPYSEQLKRQCEATFRWSALRAAIQLGHQDPTSSLISRVEAEHERAIQAQTIKPEDPPAPGGIASRIHFCLVCFGTEIDNLNPLVTCFCCNIKVHKNCYAIGYPAQLDLEVLEWYCDRCEFEKKLFTSGSCRCALCLRPGGALKRFASHPRAFMHLTCAVWTFPLVRCHNIFRLSDWKIAPEAFEVSTKHTCFLCAQLRVSNAGSEHDTKRAATRRKGKLICLGDDEDEDCEPGGVQPVNSAEITAQAQQLTDPTPEPEFPFGQNGLCIKCSDRGCNLAFHPMCAWLMGLPVTTEDDYLTSVSIDLDVFCPRLVVSVCCNEHTPPSRLPIEVIAQHRNRAYATREPGSGLAYVPQSLAKPLPGLPPVVVMEEPISETIKQKESGPSVLEPVPMMDIGTTPPPKSTRRLSGSGKKQLRKTSSVSQSDSLLAGADVYEPTICQACLEPLNEDNSAGCFGCSVVVHQACSLGVLLSTDSAENSATKASQLVCVGCAAGVARPCALCPRLGGAMIEVPSAIVRCMMKAADGEGEHPSVAVHKLCLSAQLAFGTLEGLIMSSFESFDMSQDLKKASVAEGEDSTACMICSISSGLIDAKLRSHPLCAALCGNAESLCGERPTKRRRVCGTPDEQTAMTASAELYAVADQLLSLAEALSDTCKTDLTGQFSSGLEYLTAGTFREAPPHEKILAWADRILDEQRAVDDKKAGTSNIKHATPQSADCGVTHPHIHTITTAQSSNREKKEEASLSPTLPPLPTPHSPRSSHPPTHHKESKQDSSPLYNDLLSQAQSGASEPPAAAAIDVTRKKALDGGTVLPNHPKDAQIINKAAPSASSLPSPPGTASSSDVGRRKRKRRIVQAESEDDDSTPETTAPALPADIPPVENVVASSSSAVASNPAADLGNIPRKRHQTKRPRTCSSTTTPVARSSSRVATPPPVKDEKKKKAPSLPLRNEKGQFVKKSRTTQQQPATTSAPRSKSGPRSTARWS